MFKSSSILLLWQHYPFDSWSQEYIYICYHENNVPFRLSPQWLCGNSCTWTYDVRLQISGTNKPKSAQQAKQGA